MAEVIQVLRDVRQTGWEMYRLAKTYAMDMAEFGRLGWLDCFDVVRRIPYGKDPVGMEYVRRPAYSLLGMGRGGPDCDDKAVLVGAWAQLNNLPFRFVAASRRAEKPLHHVWCEVYMGGEWVVMDATYLWSTPGNNGKWARREVLPENGDNQ